MKISINTIYILYLVIFRNIFIFMVPILFLMNILVVEIYLIPYLKNHYGHCSTVYLLLLCHKQYFCLKKKKVHVKTQLQKSKQNLRFKRENCSQVLNIVL